MNVLDYVEAETKQGKAHSSIQKIPCVADGKSFIYLTLPFAGVFCWANDVYCKTIPSDYKGNFCGMSFNFCTDGGCEVSLLNGNFVYVKKGILSIDTSTTKNEHYYPSSRYKGLEIILDFSVLDAGGMQELCAVGFNPRIFLLALSKKSVQGSFLTLPSEEWCLKAENLCEHLIASNISLEDVRFYVLELLFLISKESRFLSAADVGSLSKGQRRIASEVGEYVANHLSEHSTIEDFATQYAISPASLKKYFCKLYGMPFSVYVRHLRMEESALLIKAGLSVGEAAEKVGYKNQGKFSAAFKAHFGTSPLEYKRLIVCT